MEPIMATTGDVKMSSPTMEVAAVLLPVPGETGGEGIGRGKLGPADPGDPATFAGMLQLASRKSAPGAAQDLHPPGGHAVGEGESPFAAGIRKMAALADGETAVDGSGVINLYVLLAGLGIQKEQAEKIIPEIEGALSRLMGASAKERGVAGEKIAALLRGEGITEEKIHEVLSGLAGGMSMVPGTLIRPQGVAETTGTVPQAAERTSGAAGGGAPGRRTEKGAVPPDGQETRKTPAANPAIKASADGKGPVLPPHPVAVSDVGKSPAPAGEEVMDAPARSSAGEADQGRETRPAGTADSVALAVKPDGVFSPREDMTQTVPLPGGAVSPRTEEGKGPDVVIAAKSLPVGEEAPPKERETKHVTAGSKERPAAFKEHIAGMQQAREEGGGREEKAATGKKHGELPGMETIGKKIGAEEIGDRGVTVSRPAAGEHTPAARNEQGHLLAVGGGPGAGKAAAVPGLRPEVVIDQIVANAGQFPQNAPGRIKITLNPPHLGTLDMDVLVRSNKVEVVMIASSQEVQQVLRAHGDQLKNALLGQGLKVDGFDVMLQGNQAGPEYRFRGGGFTGDRRGEGNGNRGEAKGVAPLPGIVSRPGQQGVANRDGISLFV